MVNRKTPVSVYSADEGFTLHGRDVNSYAGISHRLRRFGAPDAGAAGETVIEVNIDASEVKRLAELLEQSPTVIETAKKDAIAAAAPKLKAAVDQAIGGSGKVRSWQGKSIGSKGLYAAVRPKKETWTEKTKKKGHQYAVGYVTNAINSGHRFPTPSGRKYYKPKIRSGAMTVKGRKFYQQAQAQTGQIAQEAAEQIVQTVMDHLEG